MDLLIRPTWAAEATPTAAGGQISLEVSTWIFLGILFLFSLIVLSRSVRVVPQGTVGVVERLGRYARTVDAGVTILLPFFDSMRRISLKEHVLDYRPQAVITEDNVTVEIDTVMYYQVTDPVKAIYEIQDYHAAIEKLTVTTLRNVIGDLTLDETLTGRETINTRLRTLLDEATDKWGIKINRVELKNIKPPAEIQTAMEKQMKAERDKRAAILEAEGARQSAILKAEGLKQATILEAQGNKEAAVLVAKGQAQAYRELFGALKEIGIDDQVIAVRYLEALEKIAQGKATKLLMPYEVSGIISTLRTMLEGTTGLKETLKELEES
jgi:regulator of protease activity HflC (stomatin/prohibitin superfamily)